MEEQERIYEMKPTLAQTICRYGAYAKESSNS